MQNNIKFDLFVDALQHFFEIPNTALKNLVQLQLESTQKIFQATMYTSRYLI